MKITYTPYLKKKYSADKFGTIQIRRTENRKSTYFTLGVSIKSKFWLKTGSVSSTHPNYIDININIEDKINELKTKDFPNKVVLASVVEEESFIEFFNSQLIYLQSRRQIGSYKSHKTSYLHFTTFLETKNIKELYFKGLTSSLMRDFETYLIELGLSINSCIKYIKTIKNVFNKGVALDKFTPIKNPFITLNKKTTPVSKKTLGRKEIEIIIQTPIDKESPLYHYKNYFLFQIFAQGIRVSDLMTLRWGNLITGEIIINQFKTKTLLKIRLNFIVLLRLADYFPKGVKIVNVKYKFKLKDADYSMSYREIEQHYNKLQKDSIGLFIQLNMSEKLEDKKELKELEKVLTSWLDVMAKIREKIKMELIIEICIYGKANPEKFIFPLLDDKIFNGIQFNAQKHILSKYQYNQLSSKTAYYNKQLKKLQELCQIDIVFTSHLARHSYTNLMIETTNKDIYTISKSLGHSSISTTEHYVNEFLTDRINESNDGMNETFLTKSY